MATIGVIAVGAFNAAKKSGLDTLGAVQAMSPALDELIGLQQTLGIESDNSALTQLTHYRDLVNGNQSLVASAEGLSQALLAINSIGGLTPEVLSAIEEQGDETFDKLTNAGFSQNEALELMADELRTVREAHEKLGIPIDENTGKLIEQAQKLGLLEDKDPTNIMKEGFDNVTAAVGLLDQALGVDVPRSIQNVIDRLGDIPRDIDSNVNVHYNDPAYTPPGVEMPEAAGAAHGGLVTQRDIVRYLADDGLVGFVPRGTDTVPAMLTPGERVLSVDQARAFATLTQRPAMPVVPSGRGGAMEGSLQQQLITVPVYLDGRQITEVVARRLPSILGGRGISQSGRR